MRDNAESNREKMKNLPGIQIAPGPAMLEFLDSSFSTVISRCDVLTRSLAQTPTFDGSAIGQFELLSASLRSYLKMLGLYLYVPLRRQFEQGNCEINFSEFENETVNLIENIAIEIYRNRQEHPIDPKQLSKTLTHSSQLLNNRREEHKRILYPIYLKIWQSENNSG